MSDKKDDNFGCGMACVLVPAVSIMGIMMCFLAGRDDNHESEYIVTDKGANAVEYYSIKNPADVHVMSFRDTVSFYPYINIGDTITGEPCFMDRPIIKEYEEYTYRTGPNMSYPKKTAKKNVISAVNGRNLYELREIARRDSLIRKMKTNQK